MQTRVHCGWQGVALAVLMFAAVPAHAQASSKAACLLMGRVEQVEQQPLQEVVLRVHVQGVSDNNVHTNEVECGKVFRTGSRLWVSLHASAFAESRLPRIGEQAWLSLRYMGGNTVLRKYEWISRKAYLEL
ncbi:MAG: hypothetical protein Q4G39_09400, partial [Brachymonas sp.]|nr:hypothetical protein [Brachymonas sp.]